MHFYETEMRRVRLYILHTDMTSTVRLYVLSIYPVFNMLIIRHVHSFKIIKQFQVLTVLVR